MIQYFIAGLSFLTLIGGLIAVYVRLTNQITINCEKHIAFEKQVEKEFDRLNQEVKLHEAMNERTFEKMFQNMDKINEKLDKLIGYLEGNGILKHK
jgi:uncharacterized membrane-anchored protein YhcB (DUF1043 family)